MKAGTRTWLLPALVGAGSLVAVADSPKATPPGALDDWGAPVPTSYNSRGFSFVVEIFPPESRQNPGISPLGLLYRTGYGGTAWAIDAALVWRAELVNRTERWSMPYQALVSMDGHVVTLDDYGELGYANAIVIYGASGELIRSYHLDELLPADEHQEYTWSTSSRWWTEGARHFFLRNPGRLYIQLEWGRILEFTLSDGAFRSGALADFPDLVKVTDADFPNEQTEVWATSLRFSSITDLLEARSGASD